jgi:hypothetical protein
MWLRVAGTGVGLPPSLFRRLRKDWPDLHSQVIEKKPAPSSGAWLPLGAGPCLESTYNAPLEVGAPVPYPPRAYRPNLPRFRQKFGHPLRALGWATLATARGTDPYTDLKSDLSCLVFCLKKRSRSVLTAALAALEFSCGLKSIGSYTNLRYGFSLAQRFIAGSEASDPPARFTGLPGRLQPKAPIRLKPRERLELVLASLRFLHYILALWRQNNHKPRVPAGR